MRTFVCSTRSRTASIRAFLLPLLAALSLAVTPQSARAESREFSASVFDVVPAKFVTAALAQPYGQAVAAQFAAALSESADAACLQSKKMTKDQVAARARAMLQVRGAAMLQRLISMTDRAVFRRNLRARIGADGVAEFDRLRANPVVRAYRATDEPAEFAMIATYIVENIQRALLINRIKLTMPISPNEVDIPSIQSADPTDKIDADLQTMVTNDKTGALARYLELTMQAQEPFRAATDMKIAQQFGPADLVARSGKRGSDLVDEFSSLCIGGPAAK